jgi:prepilin-type N-terminal cleavage/methylation domain-containing protein
MDSTERKSGGLLVVSASRELGRQGFTLVELLVTVAIMAILAALLLPALQSGKARGQGIQCLNNLRQLTVAWRLYTEDSNEQLLFATPAPHRPETIRYSWMDGRLDFDPLNPSNWEVAQDIMKSPLWPFCGNAAAVFKCPGDNSAVKPAVSRFRGQMMPRVRSISMSVWFGGFGGQLGSEVESGLGLTSPPWRIYHRMNDLIDPGPSTTALFWDQREDSINAGNFLISMVGYPEAPVLAAFAVDYPASYHNRAGGLSFADGHCEMRRWRDARTMPPLKKNTNLPRVKLLSPNNPDLVWLQERSTRRMP